MVRQFTILQCKQANKVGERKNIASHSSSQFCQKRWDAQQSDDAGQIEATGQQ